MKVCRAIIRKELREGCQNLRKAITIPDRTGSVHRRRDQVSSSRVRSALRHQGIKDFLKTGLNTLGDGGGPLTVCEEV
jgi:hypothetical protein